MREKIGVGVDLNTSVPAAVTPGSSKALLAQLQQDVAAVRVCVCVCVSMYVYLYVCIFLPSSSL